jgi:hypothetical protein
MFLPALAGIGTGLASAGSLGATGAAALGAGVAGTLTEGFAGYQQARYNQKAAGVEAEQIRMANRVNEAQQRRQLDSLLARQRAQTAASGVTFAGAPQEIAYNSLYNYLLDKNARAWNSEAQAQSTLLAGDLSMLAGRSTLLGSVLSGAGQGYLTFTNLKK